ncbi:hypothetical protein LSH36_26g11033 [Paralvinella palmiformis]|uniref:Deacetylase sirtuin-type domain-containing protein n=1 Tax=Paralvinella palmiformis TaxID=53620 RepID=A0AAD9K9L9_9ANNE|nr:hypothetical protein LSH36_26g11033 [Paralvinella palmiformis]
MASDSEDILKSLKRAANAVKKAKGLVITAGAGMSVDSGLPDYRGQEGFWRAYPPLKKMGLKFENMNTPEWFHNDPEFAWGFFGHQYDLYWRTEPHQGFQILKKWAGRMEHGHFVFTSNVDGHFKKSGFNEDTILECHGSINFMQCVGGNDSHEIWPVPEGTHFKVDASTLRAAKPLPMGPHGKNTHPARPNVLMFDDWEWETTRSDKQHIKYQRFLDSLTDSVSDVVVIEIGAGLSIPTVRYTSEGLVTRCPSKRVLIRINPSESMVPDGHISIPLNGLEALQKIDELLQ